MKREDSGIRDTLKLLGETAVPLLGYLFAIFPIWVALDATWGTSSVLSLIALVLIIAALFGMIYQGVAGYRKYRDSRGWRGAILQLPDHIEEEFDEKESGHIAKHLQHYVNHLIRRELPNREELEQELAYDDQFMRLSRFVERRFSTDSKQRILGHLRTYVDGLPSDLSTPEAVDMKGLLDSDRHLLTLFRRVILQFPSEIRQTLLRYFFENYVTHIVEDGDGDFVKLSEYMSLLQESTVYSGPFLGCSTTSAKRLLQGMPIFDKRTHGQQRIYSRFMDYNFKLKARGKDRYPSWPVRPIFPTIRVFALSQKDIEEDDKPISIAGKEYTWWDKMVEIHQEMNFQISRVELPTERDYLSPLRNQFSLFQVPGKGIWVVVAKGPLMQPIRITCLGSRAFHTYRSLCGNLNEIAHPFVLQPGESARPIEERRIDNLMNCLECKQVHRSHCRELGVTCVNAME